MVILLKGPFGNGRKNNTRPSQWEPLVPSLGTVTRAGLYKIEIAVPEVKPVRGILLTEAVPTLGTLLIYHMVSKKL